MSASRASSARNLSGAGSAPLDAHCAFFFGVTASRPRNRASQHVTIRHRCQRTFSSSHCARTGRDLPVGARAATSLKDAYRDAFKVGVAINAATAIGADSATQALVVREFNSITADNFLKAALVNPQPGVYVLPR